MASDPPVGWPAEDRQRWKADYEMADRRKRYGMWGVLLQRTLGVVTFVAAVLGWGSEVNGWFK